MKLLLVCATILAVLCSLADAASALSSACRRMYRNCAFKFSGESGPSVYNPFVVKPDTPFTPLIVSKNPKERLGVLNINGITPAAISNSGLYPITQFGNPRYTPTHLKPVALDGTFGSALAVQTFTGDQVKMGKNACAVVWFTQYQLLTRGKSPRVTANVVAKKSDMKCVVFLTPMA